MKIWELIIVNHPDSILAFFSSSRRIIYIFLQFPDSQPDILILQVTTSKVSVIPHCVLIFFHLSFTSHFVACLCVRVFHKGERSMQWAAVYSEIICLLSSSPIYHDCLSETLRC